MPQLLSRKSGNTFKYSMAIKYILYEGPTAMIHISVPYSQLTLLFFIMGQKMKKPSGQGQEVSEG